MLIKILNIIRQKTPRSAKVFSAKILISFLFFLQKIVNNNSIDIYLIELLFKIHDFERVKLLISGHGEEVYYCRFKEKIERFKALGANADNVRLDFDAKKYQKLLEVNEELIHQFPDDYLLHDRMARNYLAGGYQRKATKYIALSLKLQRKQKNLEEKTGVIFFISMPRSGTGFVSKALENGLGLKNLGSEIRFVDAWFPDYGIIEFPNYVADYGFNPMPDGFVNAHTAALKPNLWIISLITDKIIVNFRDPRQALISWVHYMEYLRFTGNFSALIQYRIPDGYFEWSIHKQIDWQINEYFIRVNVEWIRGWIEADNNPEFPCKIYFSLFENLVHNPRKYFQEIVSFYGISEDKFVHPEKPSFKSKSHLRKGSVDEWRSVLSKKQIEDVNRSIPADWFDKFNWERY